MSDWLSIISCKNDCTIDDKVHLWTRLMNEGEENFMTETRVLKCIKGLKIKNCEGVDRIPLRVLNESNVDP